MGQPLDQGQDHNFKKIVKSEFSHLDTIYFNTAYFGPSPLRAKEKVGMALQKELNPSFYEYSTWIGIAERMRAQIAKYLGTSADNVAHFSSVSDVNNTIANGVSWSLGDVAAAINLDYPSNVIPYMLRSERPHGPTFQLLNLGDTPVPNREWLAKNLSPKTKVFAISWVTFDTGKRINLIEIGKFLKERDILFVVDATQALGGMEITQEELALIDVLACASYKWMLGPYGHAFAYFSPKAQKLVAHTTGNWVTSPNSKIVYNLLNYTTETLPGARKYDRGQTSNMLANACLEASLEVMNELGPVNIRNHNHAIRDYFLSHVSTQNYQLITPRDAMGNIVCLKSLKGDPIALEAELKYHNVDVSVRQGNIRLSFHLFNTHEQVDRLLAALKM